MIQAGSPRTRPEAAFELAREVVGRRLRGAWGVLPLSPRANDFLVDRWSGGSLSIRQGWELAARLAEDPDVARAEPSFAGPGLEPDPALRAELLAPHEVRPMPRSARLGRALPCARGNPLWSLEQAHVEEAWRRRLPRRSQGRRYGEGIVVAHPDTGYTTHPEIWDASPSKRRVLARRGYDFRDDDADPLDPLRGPAGGHGTGTASVIMSGRDPDTGRASVSGVAPRARLIPFRVSDSVVHFDFANAAMAIHAAVDAKAHVISLSLGGPFPSAFLQAAIDRALASGLIVLAAAGNVWPFVVYPARYPQVLAVAAVNCQKRPWSWSAHGPGVDIAAAGESVWRARTAHDEDDPYQVSPGSGTSYAVATTAGACALWLAYHGPRHLADLYGRANLWAVFRHILLRQGVERPRGWKTSEYGAGILRADRLLAPLPKSVPAPVAPRAPRGAIDELAGYFPRGDRHGLPTALAAFLRVQSGELEPALARHGDELVFHVATNASLRSSLHSAARRGARPMSPRRGLARSRELARNASRALCEQLGLP